MRVLVTGGTGLVGKYLKEICPDWIYVSSKDFDLASQRESMLMIAQEKPDVVIHLAGKVGGILSNQALPCDFIEQNLLINTNVLRACRQHDVKHFTGVISTCAYPDVSPVYPLTEDMLFEGPPAKSNFAYGMAKRSLAAHINACNEQHNTKYNYIIPCNLYGKYDDFSTDGSHYVSALIRKIYNAMANGEKHIDLLGTGKPIRQFMYAGDLAGAIKRMVYEGKFENFNVATPEVHSIQNIAMLAIRSLGVDSDLSIRFLPNFPDGQFRKDASGKKFKELFPGFEFTYLVDGIRKTFEYYKEAKRNGRKI